MRDPGRVYLMFIILISLGAIVTDAIFNFQSKEKNAQ